MKSFLFFFGLIFYISLFFPLNSKAELVCGESENLILGDTVYPYDPNGETITVKFLFVAFEGDLDGQVVTLDEHQEAVNGMISYINEISHGKLVLSPNSGIILHPEDVLDEANPAQPSWVAQLSAAEYRTGDCDDCVDLSQPYEDLWSPRVSGWYVDGEPDESNRATELLAEMFWTIKNEYEQYPTLPSPFDEEIGAIIIVFQSVTSPDATAGGRPHITLNVNAINAGTDFFSNLKVVDEEFAGTISRQAVADPVSEIFDIEKCKMAALHEFVHTLGLIDGPPSFAGMRLNCGQGNLCEYRYYFGNQNLMSQHYVPGYGVPPIGLSVLETLPWYSEANDGVFDFTGENIYGERIYDIRGENGKIYKFRLGDYPGSGTEDFVMAYHTGLGEIDSQTGVAGGPVLPSQGLEIWHRVGNDVHDLESAVGNWKFGTAGFNTYVIPASNGIPDDRLNGYDNHDVWDVEEEVSRDAVEYENYLGEEYDYFRTDLENSDFNNDEFSFRSNPRSFGYNKSEGSHEFLRRRPQDVTNSLVVKLHGSGIDANGEKYMLVDLLSAPGGVVLHPTCYSEPASYVLGNKIPIIWEHDQYGEAAESVDILFSKFGGDYYQETLIANLPVNSGQGSWHWFPTAEHGTSNGRIKVVFHNSNSDYTNSAESDCGFIISAPMIVEEYIVSPNGGEAFNAGHLSVIPVTWTNLMANIPGEDIDSVDVEFSTDDGVNWILVQSGMTFPGDFDVDDETGYNVFEMQVTDGMVSEQARIRLHFHSGSDVATQQSESSFVVFPVEAKFTDVSSGTGATYQGEPYNAISLDYDSDDKLDLLISMQDVEGAFEPESVMLKNTGLPGGAITFEYANDDAFEPLGQPALDSRGITSGNYDNDGQEDVFVSHESLPRLYNNTDGVLINKIDETNVISNTDRPKLNHSSCATWVDYDHDSDLDLFIGRVSGINSGNPSPVQDYVLINDGTGSFSGTQEIGDNQGFTSSAVWCDFNQDGLWEVVVGDFQSGFASTITTMYTESTTRPGEFSEVPGGLPVDFNRTGVAALYWVDYDRDGDLDLFVNRSNGSSEILKNNQWSLDEVVVPFSDPNWNSAAATPLDYNLDGWPDFVLSDPTNSPQLRLMANLMGNPDFTENKFGDVTQGSGFVEFSGPARGILPCDFNNDGDLDLFLGTQQTSSSGNAWLLGNSQKGGEDTPLHRFLSVDLISSSGNKVSLGAIVALETPMGVPLGTQTIDGGSGLGGQIPKILVFGLGEYSGDVKIKVYWPSGRRITQTVSSATIAQGTTVTVVAGNDLQVFDSTIKRSIIFDPNTLSLHWTIDWQTDYWSDGDLDLVTITRVSGQNCGSETAILQAGDSDVIVQTPEYFVDSATGLIAFKHKVEWKNQPCHPSCRYSIEVESSNGINTDSGVSSRDATFKTCPSGTGQGGQ